MKAWEKACELASCVLGTPISVKISKSVSFVETEWKSNRIIVWVNQNLINGTEDAAIGAVASALMQNKGYSGIELEEEIERFYMKMMDLRQLV